MRWFPASAARTRRDATEPVGTAPRPPAAKARGRRLSPVRWSLLLGATSILLGLGYFSYHWAYGAWAYQGRHVRLREVYMIFLVTHEDRLDLSLESHIPDHRDMALERRRINLLRSEVSWQDWLAGPYRRGRTALYPTRRDIMRGRGSRGGGSL